MTLRKLLRPIALLGVAVLAAAYLAAPARAQEPGAGKHFFWKVTGGKGVAYVFGTIHVGNQEMYPLAPVIEDGFKQSDVLIEELDLSSPGGQPQLSADVLKSGLYLDGDSIANHLSEATRTELADYAKSSQLMAGYTHAKPWLVSLLIMQLQISALGLDKSKGLDLHFTEEAAATHKPIEGLETADEQLKMFSSFPDKLQDQMLLETLLDAHRAGETLDNTLAAWKSGDTAAMEAVITEEVRRYPFLQPVMDKLFYERNDSMTQKIDALLQTPKVYFVAIGAGHLVGARGILAQLRGKHYTVEQP